MSAANSAATTTPAGASKIALLDHFARLDDPRQSAKVVFPLPEIMLLVLSATIAGCDDLVEVCEWGRERLDFLRRYLLFRDDIPSHDTLTDVVNALDPELFKSCFMDWVACLRDGDPEIVAVDGKTSRRTHDRGKDRKPLHLVSAWASRQRLVLGQQATAEKSNEITAIPLLLERLHLKGAIVTIDAMGCQTTIAEKIIEKGGDYCLALKGNRPALQDEVERLFADPKEAGVSTQTIVTTDNDHGRLEIRRHTVCHDIDWLLSDRRYPGEMKFPGLAMIGMVESETERNGKVERARRYYLCSTKLTAQTFATVVRAHWGVESAPQAHTRRRFAMN
jgi:predicted transposase YbfD/YdcC